ncbi:hypothetical protein D9M71_265200 [compost metagenome]
MGRDGGHHRHRHGLRRGTGTDLSAAQLHPGAAGDDVRPDRLVGGDDAAGFHRLRALHSDVGAARGRGAACAPVFGPGRARPGRDCLDTGRLDLDAAALPARCLRQSALRDQRNLAHLDHARATPGAHYGPLFIDRFGWLRHRPTVARPGRHAGLAALHGWHPGLPSLRPDRACGRAAPAEDAA